MAASRAKRCPDSSLGAGLLCPRAVTRESGFGLGGDGTAERLEHRKSKLAGEGTSGWSGTSWCFRAISQEPFDWSEGAGLEDLEKGRDRRATVVLGSRIPIN